MEKSLGLDQGDTLKNKNKLEQKIKTLRSDLASLGQQTLHEL